MKTKRPQQGSALIFALMAMLVLTLLGIEVTRLVLNKYQNTFHAASWQESLMAAESGVDMAMVELQKTLTTTGTAQAWQSPWTASTSNGVTTYTLPTVQYSGEGGTKMSMSVVVDAFAGGTNSAGWQYYRIRSVGGNSIPGMGRVGDEKRDLDLRKLSLRVDRYTGATLATPKAQRKVEVIARPISPFSSALLSKGLTSMTSQNVVVDSYDSTDPTKSVNGQYDVSVRQQHGDVVTDGQLIAAGNAQIYGNASTNGGTVTGIANVTGEIRDDFYQDVPSVNNPTWSNIQNNPNVINGGAGNSKLGANNLKGTINYKVSSLTLNGNDTLTINANPSQISYVNIWVTGDLSITGNGSVNIDPSVVVTWYVNGNIDLSGNGVHNGNGQQDDRPGHNLIYAIKPANGATQTVKLSGNANIEACVYAPDADVTINGGGSNGSFSGSVVGNTITMTGITNVHYDESLLNTGPPSRYKIASWFEDTK